MNMPTRSLSKDVFVCCHSWTLIPVSATRRFGAFSCERRPDGRGFVTCFIVNDGATRATNTLIGNPDAAVHHLLGGRGDHRPGFELLRKSLVMPAPSPPTPWRRPSGRV